MDGARGVFSCALSAERVFSREIPANRALESGLNQVAGLLSEAGIEPAHIERIATGTGPGTFTGVRIAISYAKSLAQAWGLPLTGIDTFDAVEAGLEFSGPALCVVRGRPGVVSVRLRHSGTIRRLSGYVGDVLDALGPPEGTLTLSGDAQDVLGGLAERGWSLNTVTSPLPTGAAAVAALAALREPAASVHEVRADYGELPPARVPKLAGKR